MRFLGRHHHTTSQEYDFNDPLLETALLNVSDAGPVIVALMFLQPGKHAGAGGDIAEIIAGAVAKRSVMTTLSVRPAIYGRLCRPECAR